MSGMSPHRPYPGSHVAVFPTKIAEPCIKADTSEIGVCRECGAPWERLMEREFVGDRNRTGEPMFDGGTINRRIMKAARHPRGHRRRHRA